jgi:hypothetical protein
MELAPRINADGSVGRTQGQKITTSLFLPLGNLPLKFIAYPEIIETFALPHPIENSNSSRSRIIGKPNTEIAEVLEIIK